MSWLQFIGNSSQFGGSQLPSHLHPHPLAQGELVLCEQVDDLPEEHALECACELLLAIGAGARNVPLDGDAMGPPRGPRNRVAMKSMKHSDAIGWVVAFSVHGLVFHGRWSSIYPSLRKTHWTP